jgi:propane monooxygenase reductase component
MDRRHTVKIEPAGLEIEAAEDETVLQAAFRQGLTLAHGCKHGQCAACKSFLLAGEVELDRYSTFALADYELEEGYTLLCRAHAFSDLEVELLHYDPVMLTAGHPIRTVKTTVEQIQPLTRDIYHLSIAPEPGEALEFTPGQYVDIHIPGSDEKRSYSMCNPPAADGRLEFMVKRYPSGRFSGLLEGMLDVGDELWVTGPYGVCVLREGSDADLIFVACGSGMAPIWSLLNSLVRRGGRRNITYHYGARSEDGLFYERELRDLSTGVPGFRFVASLSHPSSADWKGEVGRIEEVIDRAEGDLSRYEAYLCGPPAMIEGTIPILLAHGLPEASIFYDKFTITADIGVTSVGR